jgi:hypothetical protein
MSNPKLDGIAARAEAFETRGTPGRHAPEDRRDLLAALRAVEVLASQWTYKGEFGRGSWQEGHGPGPYEAALDDAAAAIRGAISGALA